MSVASHSKGYLQLATIMFALTKLCGLARLRSLC